MQICVLGSGSSGNCTVVHAAGRAVLIDLGFGPRTVGKRLAGTGLTLRDVDAAVLTHPDADHFRPSWLAALARHRIPLHVHRRHEHAVYGAEPTNRDGIDARALHREGLLERFADQPFALPATDGAMRARPVRLDHDRDGTVGLVLSAGGRRLGYATDLGRVPDDLLEALSGVDVLAVESNYDPRMQRESDRPETLKRRITGGAGHLSNEQALEAVRSVARSEDGAPSYVVLLHVSRQCNDPALIRRLYADDPALADRLWIANQFERTEWIGSSDQGEPTRPEEQMVMFG